MGQSSFRVRESVSAPDYSEDFFHRICSAISKLWPTVCIIAGFITLAALLIFGTRASGNPNTVGYRTPVAASFGMLYSVPVIVALILFRAGRPKRFSWWLSAMLCVLVIACSTYQSVAGSSRSNVMYVACFIEIGCLSVWCLLARDMPTSDCLLENCVVVALSFLIASLFLIVNYAVMARVGFPAPLPVLPIAMHCILCRYGQPARVPLSGQSSQSGKSCPIGACTFVASVGLGLAFSCTFSLCFRSWLNDNALTACVPVLMSCGCLLAVSFLILLRRWALACMVTPPAFCGIAMLLGAAMHDESHLMIVAQLVLFSCGLSCTACVLMSVLPSFCAGDHSSSSNSLGMQMALIAIASCLGVPTLEMVGAFLGDIDFLGQVCSMALLAYVACCCWLYIAHVRRPILSSPDESESSAIYMVAKEYGLTARETDVLEELFKGRTAPYIARDLSVSINTVRSHVKQVYTKFSVHSQQELIDLIATVVPKK